MPIKRKSFEEGKFEVRFHDRSKHPVAMLLSKNINLAYTVIEMSKKLKMKEETVRNMLRMLKKDKLIVHKAPYFAWKKSKK